MTCYELPNLLLQLSRFSLHGLAVGRTVVDSVADNSYFGAMVMGGRPLPPEDVDMRWISALLYKNEVIEETGVAAGVMNHPAHGVAWLANTLAQQNQFLDAGEIILAGPLREQCQLSVVMLCSVITVGWERLLHVSFKELYGNDLSSRATS